MRRGLARLGVLLWLLGFELLPGLHIAGHGRLAPHTHGAPTEVERGHGHAHGHAHGHGHGHGHGHAHAHGHRPPAAPTPEVIAARNDPQHEVLSPLDPHHGRHDVLHRGLAVIESPDAEPTIHAAPFVRVLGESPITDAVGTRTPPSLRARGPPDATSCRPVDRTSAVPSFG